MHADVHELFQVLSDDYFHRRGEVSYAMILKNEPTV